MARFSGDSGGKLQMFHGKTLYEKPMKLEIYGGFLQMEVPPKWLVKIMDNPVKWMILGVPLF